MELDLTDIKPSVLSFITIGIMAMVFLSLAKFGVNRFTNPVTLTFREFVNAL